MDERNLNQLPAQDEPIEPVRTERPELVEAVSDEEVYDDANNEPFEGSEPDEPAFSWQASEFVHHHKGIGWYATLAAAVLVLSILAVIFKFWLSIGVFLAMGAAIAVYAHKPPRVLTYGLDADGVSIEGKAYPYKNFRSFGVISDADWHTIDLEPTQRFMPRLTVLFGDDDFDTIVDHLSLHLPRFDRQPDLIERATRYLRF